MAKPFVSAEMMCLRVDNAGLRAENAELRQRIEGMEGTVDALRVLLEKSQPSPPDHVADPDEALRHAEPAGQA